MTINLLLMVLVPKIPTIYLNFSIWIFFWLYHWLSKVYSWWNPCYKSWFFFYYINIPKFYGVFDVKNVICSIKKNGSIDYISMKFFKSYLFYEIPYKCKLLNLCMQHGVNRYNLKIAKVIPIHKKKCT